MTGFAVLSEVAVFQYKCDKYYHPEADGVHSVKESSVNSEELSLHIPA